VHDEIARYYEQSRATGFVTFGTQLGGVKLVLGGSGRFTESHLASVRKMVLYADTICPVSFRTPLRLRLT
jgi:hypothetical protein